MQIQTNSPIAKARFRPSDEITGREILPGCNDSTPTDVVELLRDNPEVSMLDLGHRLQANHERNFEIANAVVLGGGAAFVVGMAGQLIGDLVGYTGFAGVALAAGGVAGAVGGLLLNAHTVKAFREDDRSLQMLVAAERSVPGASPYTRYEPYQETPAQSCLESGMTRNLRMADRRHEEAWWADGAGGGYPDSFWRNHRAPSIPRRDVCSRLG